jgi:hypothetical protein
MMVIGYAILGNSSNDGSFFYEKTPDGVLCPACGTCQNYSYAPTSIDISKSNKYDVSYTHDLRKLFSQRSTDYVRNELRAENEFIPIQTHSSVYFYMFPQPVIRFDVERRKTKFVNHCDTCGGYESIVGAYPGYYQISEPVGPGFYRSDIAFSSGSSKFPMFVVGEKWKEKLESQKFRGITFEEVYGT